MTVKRYACRAIVIEDARALGADTVLIGRSTTPRYLGDWVSVYFLKGKTEIAHYSPIAVCNFEPVTPLPFVREWCKEMIGKYEQIHIQPE